MSTACLATPKTFMELVVAWPGPDEPGYVNLHWFSPKGNGLRGKPFKDLQEFMSFAQYAATKPDTYKEIYFCLSAQSMTGKTIHGYATAHRDAMRATKLKAVWLDIDIKQDDKHYHSLVEAYDALNQFVAAAQLPTPSALVHSGGGVHVYWISKGPLSLADWRPFAEGLKAEALRLGLKCDTQITADAARVLRVPGTFNNKETKPRPVVLKHLGTLYDFPTDLAHLPPLAPVAPRLKVTGTVTGRTHFPFDLSAFAGKAMHPLFQQAGLDPQFDNLASGLNTHADLPLAIDQIVKNCHHFADTMVTHGLGQSEPLWQLTLLGCSFLENGREWAHYASKGCPTYSRTETDIKYDQKLTARAQSNVGWPSCQAFESAGCSHCRKCPLHGKIRSPLHLASRVNPLDAESFTEGLKKQNTLPVEAIRTLYKGGAAKETLFAALNETYAVVRYGREVLIASIIDRDVLLMEPEDFHKMFGNVRIGDGVEVSRLWLKWRDRRQYFGRGMVFEPGGPLEVADDMLNLWRGFGIEPKQGDWSLLDNHMRNVLCSRQQAHFDYLIRWMAYAVQHPNEPIGVAVAFRGAQGAGKGIVARTFGKFFGKHFAHIANGEHLTGRFNASVATSCAVFLDEALWAGDKKGEGVLKALITEPRLQLEAKFRDPIMVENRLRIMVASNNDWCVPAGIGDRRWFILDVADTFAGTTHRDYWDALYAEIENGGASAMFHDLLAMDLSDFDVRAVPHTAAKAQQQTHSLQGTEAWLYHLLQEGSIGCERWQDAGLTVSKDHAYGCFEAFSKQQRAWRPEIKALWSKKIRTALGPCVADTRPKHVRSFQFAPLGDCRRRFEAHAGAPNIEWEADTDPDHSVRRKQATQDDVSSLGGPCDAPAIPEAFQRAINQSATDLALLRKMT